MFTKKGQNTKLNAIYERLVYDKSGALLRVRFIIADVAGNGVLQPQIISVTPESTFREIDKREKDTSGSSRGHFDFAASTTTAVAPILLSNPKPVQTTPTPVLAFFESVISPYISLDFLMSQPTRAPSCN